MIRRRGATCVVGLTIWSVSVAACGLSGAQTTPLDAWFGCDECVNGEIDAVVALGDATVPELRDALRAPILAAEQALRRSFGQTWTGLDNPQSDSARYVNQLAANVMATRQSRAATALGAIGTPDAEAALRDALADDAAGVVTYRPDVRRAIHTAIYVVTGRVEWDLVTAAPDHSCGGLGSGRVYCWGLAADGRLGTPRTTSGVVTEVVPAATNASFQSLGAGATHSCGVTETGMAVCWGAATAGQLGNGTTTGERAAPTPVATTRRFVTVSAGGGNLTCAIDTQDQGWCWGDNTGGQLGGGQVGGNAVTPQALDLNLPLAHVSTSRGGSHACAVAQRGELYCWGTSPAGALGLGGVTTAATPARVGGTMVFARVSTGGTHTCAIDLQRAVLCWGSDAFDQLGNGAAGAADTPTPIDVSRLPAGIEFVAVAAGARHTCAIASTGQAYCWGFGEGGRIGDGEAVNRPLPTLVGGGLVWRDLRAADHTCGITDDARLFCWGPGLNGKLGNGDELNRMLPTEIQPPIRL